MANLRSSEKNIRKIKTQTARNRVVKDNVKAARKAVLAAIKSGDAKAAAKSLSEFASVADKAAKRSVLHKNKSSRLKSRLAEKVKAVALGTAAKA